MEERMARELTRAGRARTEFMTTRSGRASSVAGRRAPCILVTMCVLVGRRFAAVSIAVLGLVGCVRDGVRYADGPEWASATGRYCAHCGGGETATIVVERTVGETRETVSVEVESCIDLPHDDVARVVHMRHHANRDYEVVAEVLDVPIDVVECSEDGPIHFRFRDELGGRAIRFDVRVANPEVSLGWE